MSRGPADSTSQLTSGVGAVLAAAVAVAGIVFSEGLIVSAVVVLGPWFAFLVVWAFCAAASALIVWAFDAEAAQSRSAGLVTRMRGWVTSKRDEASRRMGRLAHLAWWLAFVVLSVTVGPFITTIAVKLRGSDGTSGYLLAALSSLLFALVWVTVYAGGLVAVQALL